jgi:hypothetical protein
MHLDEKSHKIYDIRILFVPDSSGLIFVSELWAASVWNLHTDTISLNGKKFLEAALVGWVV